MLLSKRICGLAGFSAVPAVFLVIYTPDNSFDISDIKFGDKTEIIQEFIEDLYLLGGYRFDVGVYVTITSINPIRAYVYNEWRVK